MINTIPDNWEYTDSLEMLYLFYQCADELLSEVTPDTYALPQHNVVTLLCEIEEVFDLINAHNMLDEYYAKYIPPIIEEFIDQTEKDYIFKRIVGNRLLSIRTGFEEAKTTHAHLSGWISVFKQACSMRKYHEMYEKEIVRLITTTTEKQKLITCTTNYFITLTHIGYSREYLYTTAKRFFNNDVKAINSSNQIKAFLQLFACKREEYEFLILMDIDSIEYMDSISDNLVFSSQIERIDLKKERSEIEKDFAGKKLLQEYDRRVNHKGAHEKIAIVRFKDRELDPYIAVIRFTDYIRFLQTFSRYFKHFYFSKQVFLILQKCTDGRYREIRLPNKLQKRPFVNQDMIDMRISNLLNAKSMGEASFYSLTRAIEMHSEAFDSRNTLTLFRTFWTALETLFANYSSNGVRDNVINSVLSIIQKTYLLKVLRGLYAQLEEAVPSAELTKHEIVDFVSFVEFFAIHGQNSEEMKSIYLLLAHNPLLRSRLYNIRKCLSNGKNISVYLESHKQRIEWQLKRLHRIRNIATHLGTEIKGIEIALNHLHNYFDYVVNFMLCKSENGDYIESTSAVVFEAKNDNKIHCELLKTGEELSQDNFQTYLFGPDPYLIAYKFEH